MASRNMSLFEPRANARRTDRFTSYAAAHSVKSLRASQVFIMRLFRKHGSMSDEQLIDAVHRAHHPVLRMSDSGIRTRRSELVGLGYLHASNKRDTTRHGRKSIVWVTTHSIRSGSANTPRLVR